MACMKRAGPSMARAKSWRLVEPSVRPIVRPWCLAARMIAAAAASRPTTASVTWMAWRRSREANASTRTPMSAVPKTMSNGRIAR